MLGRRRPHHSPSARGPARKRRPARKRNNPSHIRQPEQPGNVTDMIRIIGSAPAAGRRGGGMEVYSIISGGLTGGRRPGVCARGSPAQRGLQAWISRERAGIGLARSAAAGEQKLGRAGRGWPTLVARQRQVARQLIRPAAFAAALDRCRGANSSRPGPVMTPVRPARQPAR